MARSIMDSGKIKTCKVMALKLLQMVVGMKDTTLKTKRMVTEFTFGLMEANMQDGGIKANSTGWEF